MQRLKHRIENYNKNKSIILEKTAYIFYDELSAFTELIKGF